MDGNVSSIIIIIIMVLFVIFLLLRELNCWYWKINQVVDLLKRIESKLPDQVITTKKTNSLENNMSKVQLDEVEVQSLIRKFSSYPTDKLKNMQSMGVDQYTMEALRAIKLILEKRNE